MMNKATFRMPPILRPKLLQHLHACVRQPHVRMNAAYTSTLKRHAFGDVYEQHVLRSNGELCALVRVPVAFVMRWNPMSARVQAKMIILRSFHPWRPGPELAQQFLSEATLAAGRFSGVV